MSDLDEVGAVDPSAWDRLNGRSHRAGGIDAASFQLVDGKVHLTLDPVEPPIKVGPQGVPVADLPPRPRAQITLTFAQYEQLGILFGGDADTEMAIIDTDKGHSGPGIYAYYEDMPEEGSFKLDEDDLPAKESMGHPIGFPLNKHTRDILGTSGPQCKFIAQFLRNVLPYEIGHEGPNEQATVIYWLLGMYRKHRENWRAKVLEVLGLEEVSQGTTRAIIHKAPANDSEKQS